MKKTADVIVVGCGVIGAASTFYLASEGVEVLCLERNDLASGSTSACDGDVLVVGQPAGYKSQLTLASQQLLRDLDSELDDDFELRERGSLLVVESEQDASNARSWVVRQRNAGVPVTYIEGKEVFEREPLLARDVTGLVECSCDSSLNPMALVYALAHAAGTKGARFLPRTEVVRLLLDGRGHVVGVSTRDETYRSACVVLAAGVWSPAIAATAGIDLPVEPRKGHLLVSERTPITAQRKLMEFGYLAAKFGGAQSPELTPAMAACGVAMVMEPTAHGNFLVGSSREFVGYDTSCNRTVIALIARRAVRFFPAIANVRIIRAFAGLRPSTPDVTPIVSSVQAVPGLYIATGHEGTGIALAPITGRLIADMIAGRTPPVPVEPLRFERFAAANQHY